jgi:hypothetical protein
MADDALSGAAQGAAQGSALGPMGTAAGAVIGGVSGFMAGRRKQKAARNERRRQTRIRALASPAHLADVMKSLQPMMKMIVASNLGPQFQTMVADSLAKHGLTGTGVGEAFRSSAAAAPAIFATEGAASEAGNVVNRELAAEGMAGPEPAPVQNPLIDALMGGARGVMSMGGSTRPAGGGTPVNYGSAGIMEGQNSTTNLPNITPEDEATARHGTPNVFSR